MLHRQSLGNLPLPFDMVAADMKTNWDRSHETLIGLQVAIGPSEVHGLPNKSMGYPRDPGATTAYLGSKGIVSTNHLKLTLLALTSL